MNHLATISSKFQVSLPKELRERLGLRPGDHLVAEEHDGNLVLTPAATVPREQRYFWSRRWQEGEAKAEEDIAAGRISEPILPEEVETMAAKMLSAHAGKISRRKKP